jgi:hypothetical protein
MKPDIPIIVGLEALSIISIVGIDSFENNSYN